MSLRIIFYKWIIIVFILESMGQLAYDRVAKFKFFLNICFYIEGYELKNNVLRGA